MPFASLPMRTRQIHGDLPKSTSTKFAAVLVTDELAKWNLRHRLTKERVWHYDAHEMTATLEGIGVLAVDDDADGLEMLEFVMIDAGAVVRTATSGPDALAILAGWTPSVLLLDVAMPFMDGCALLRTIRCQPAFAEIPAIAVTARACPSDQERAFEAGFAVHIAKPFDVPALLDLIEWLAKSRAPSRDNETAASK